MGQKHKKRDKGVNNNESVATCDDFHNKLEQIDLSTVQYFDDLPLSTLTIKCLKQCGYTKPTDIQRETIRLTLLGRDVLGAAPTGSGKTLAFLIPILERLHHLKWTSMDGLGALIITPTRELAYQIFEAMRRVGALHDFSAGLVIGGKDLKFERHRMDTCNIIVCTPGRLLQHMDENPLFDCVHLQILVLDEADRCLDMGFEPTMNAIIANLPPHRQTLLFSATQTKSVRQLARLSLKDPSFISVHTSVSDYGTPTNLQQAFMICELKDKVSVLFSFIKNHLKQKTIVFFASCKQTKFVHEIFCKLKPGVSLLALYGSLHQLRRLRIYEDFASKSAAVLFATDVAARGLDFPNVDWVVQFDCPEDAATYVHRVGRTARYKQGGESLLMLLPSETKLLDDLDEKKIPIEETQINSSKLCNPVRRMSTYLARDRTLKESAQRAFVAYAKSVYLMKDKKIFNISSLDMNAYSESLGLEIPPRIRFLQRINKRLSDEKANAYLASSTKELKSNGKLPTMNRKIKCDYSKDDSVELSTNAQDNLDDLFEVERRDDDINAIPVAIQDENMRQGKLTKKTITRAALAKKIIVKGVQPNKKIIFDEEGVGTTLRGSKQKESDLGRQYENELGDSGGLDLARAEAILKEEDKFDKAAFKLKVQAKHRKEKQKLKKMKGGQKNAEETTEDETSDYEPDLSWLPDPDKIYGPELNSENNIDNDKTDELKIHKKKRKLYAVDEFSEQKGNKLAKIAKGLNIQEAEDLALMLIKQPR